MPEVSHPALVVEDDPDVARFVQLVLERRAGMDVVVTGDAESALEALTAGQFDLIVTDIEFRVADAPPRQEPDPRGCP